MGILFHLLLGALRTATRSRQDLVLENAVLRHQLAVYRRSRRRGPGRPRLDRDTQDLIRQMARDNLRWGAIRSSACCRPAASRCASTVRVYLRQALRRPPSPQ